MMRGIRRVALMGALVLGFQAAAGAQGTPAAGGASSATPLFCPLSARVDALKSNPDQIVISLWSVDGTARATGTLVLYAGNLRYQIPFTNVVAASVLNDAIPPTPIVVRFATPTIVDSGYVGSLDNGPCLVHDPFVLTKDQKYSQDYGSDDPIDSRLYPDWTAAWQTFRAAAALATPILAAGAERVDPPVCAEPYAPARATHSTQLNWPQSKMYTGLVAVRVTVDAKGGPLGYHIDKDSHERPFNDAAVIAASHVRFTPEIYRCSPVTGDYVYVVDFMDSPFQDATGH